MAAAEPVTAAGVVGQCLRGRVPQAHPATEAALGIAGVSTTESSWRYRPPEGSEERGLRSTC